MSFDAGKTVGTSMLVSKYQGPAGPVTASIDSRDFEKNRNPQFNTFIHHFTNLTHNVNNSKHNEQNVDRHKLFH